MDRDELIKLILDKTIKEEEDFIPSLHILEEFEGGTIWRWLSNSLTLYLRQVTAELLIGKNTAGDKLTPEDTALRRGEFTAIENVFALIEEAKQQAQIKEKEKRDEVLQKR